MKKGKNLLLLLLCGIVFLTLGVGSSNSYSTEHNKYEKNKKVKVTVVDLSEMTEAERDNWCDENKVNCKVKKEYSDTVKKDSFVSQSIEVNKIIYQGDEIIITISLGKKPTVSQQNAIKSAELYLNSSSFSRKGLINQLKFEGYSEADSTFAVDYLNVNWKEQAVKTAESYLNSSSFSKKGLYNQLIFEGFTAEQANYGVEQAYK